MTELRDALIRDAKGCLDNCYERIEHCTNQLSAEELWRRPAKGMNSVGNLILHLTGNLRQWIIVGLSGGEDRRDRPSEFAEEGPLPAERILSAMQDAIREAQLVLDQMDEEDLLRRRRIQGFDLDGVQAIFDSLPHFKGHTQEIMCLTRMCKGDAYQFHWQPTTPEEGAPSG